MTTSVASHLDKTALNFVERTHKMLINGQWVGAASGMTFPTYNPATGQVLSHAAEGDKADVDAAVRAAREAFDHGPWRKFTASERGRMIWKLADLLEQHTEEFAKQESIQMKTCKSFAVEEERRRSQRLREHHPEVPEHRLFIAVRTCEQGY